MRVSRLAALLITLVTQNGLNLRLARFNSPQINLGAFVLLLLKFSAEQFFAELSHVSAGPVDYLAVA